MEAKGILDRLDALRGLRGDGTSIVRRHNRGAIPQACRLWFLVDGSSQKARILCDRLERDGGRPIPLLDVLGIDNDSMVGAHPTWRKKVKESTDELGRGFVCRQFNSTWFLTVNDDGLAESGCAPQDGVIVRAGSKEARDVRTKINTAIRELERTSMMSPSGIRLPPTDRVTPSPDNNNPRKRKRDDASDDDESDEEDEEEGDEVQLDERLSEEIVDKLLTELMERLSVETDDKPNPVLQALAQRILSRCLKKSSDNKIELEHKDSRNRDCNTAYICSTL